jgi:peroxiredoxin Q/BCP
MKLQTGDAAPAFSAYDQHGTMHALEDYHGKWLLLYFYPKDDTPGCTKEACGFRDHFAELKNLVMVLGVSKDSAESHEKFVQKYTLPFPLLTDSDQKLIATYGADGVALPKRVSFLINPEGAIAKIYDKVDCDAHAAQVLEDISHMQ